MSLADFPRVLLLSGCSPQSRYAGGEALRRLLARLPAERILWFGVRAGTSLPGLPEYRSAPLRRVHWRLEGSLCDFLYLHEVQPRRVARAIWTSAREFTPEVLWIVPELAAAPVGRELRRISGLPAHATVHDAPEFCANVGVPRSYAARYASLLRRTIRCARSVDCVSQALRSHLESRGALAPGCRAGVVAPITDVPPQPPVMRPGGRDRIRRIGLCGSFRTSRNQWAGFLQFLAQLPFSIEIISLADPDSMPHDSAPASIRFVFPGYAETEADIVREFRERGVDACYLGLWTEPGRTLFARTSLSSKLTTYSAAGLPVLVDAPQDSVAWTLVSRYGAGVRCAEDAADRTASVTRLFSDDAAWRDMSAGSAALCSGEFSAEKNVARMVDLLRG